MEELSPISWLEQFLSTWQGGIWSVELKNKFEREGEYYLQIKSWQNLPKHSLDFPDDLMNQLFSLAKSWNEPYALVALWKGLVNLSRRPFPSPVSLGSFIKKLKISLIENDTDENRKEQAKNIHYWNVEIKDLLPLLKASKKVSMRFSWLIGDVLEENPERVRSALPDLFEMRNNLPFPNFDRTVAKSFKLAGIPEEMEGEVTDQLFQWISDPAITVSTKTYAMQALSHIVKKYPEMMGEFRLVVTEQIEKSPVSFRKAARKLLAEMTIEEFNDN